jgi:hypothetical protein
MKYSKYFGAKRCGFIKSKSVLAPKGTIHLLNENIRYDRVKQMEPGTTLTTPHFPRTLRDYRQILHSNVEILTSADFHVA